MIRTTAAVLLASLLAGGALAQTSSTNPAPGTPPAGAAKPAPAAPPAGAAKPAAATPPTGAAKPAAATPPQSSAAKPAPAPAIDTAATEFKDEASAKAHCPTDTVVWLNTAAKVYHLPGTRYYGKTKKGAYSCKQDADHRGFRVVRGELVKPAPSPTATKP